MQSQFMIFLKQIKIKKSHVNNFKMVSELIDLSLEKWLKLIHALIAIRMSSSLDLTVLVRKSANN